MVHISLDTQRSLKELVFIFSFITILHRDFFGISLEEFKVLNFIFNDIRLILITYAKLGAFKDYKKYFVIIR